MKAINEYLSTKIKTSSYISNINDYCLLAMYDADKTIADEIRTDYEDVFLPNNANSNGSGFYLIPLKDAEQYIKHSGIVLYAIPDFCHNIEDVESAAEDGRLNEDELEEII